MKAILFVLSALTAITLTTGEINKDCRACLFITAVIKKAMVHGQEIVSDKITAITCPKLMQSDPRHMEKVCKRVIADTVGSSALLKKIKRGKKLGNWMSYFCSRELPKKYCPDGYHNPRLFRELSKI
ncbi:hypothetical protein ANCCAN_09203 [Ancylostoma caninum]|uniref:Saposin B-type domain-containing protein n=1 Tax=Ancylostoma caninum TaxID=29170 RepID=A0A368GK85_ANCCA|nr:hypothetical protein ANCCAN_09203 [Ancylostoma caninum]